MAYKDILVHLDHYRGADVRLRLALSLAKRNEARIAGLYAFQLPRVPYSRVVAGAYVEDNAALTAYERERDTAFNHAAYSEAEFHAEARRAGLKSDWQLCPDKATELVTLVTERARYADLTVLGQADSAHPFFDTLAKLPEAVMLGCGRPVLVVPYASSVEEVGKHVLVAWSGTREAARAVGDALPLLQSAVAVTLISIGRTGDDSEHQERPLRELAQYLLAHGIHAHVSLAVSNELEAGALLLSRAGDIGCDLLVMGGYGHSRTRELILGGVTRFILQHMTVPVLMSH